MAKSTYKIMFHGKPGSGKSQMINRLKSQNFNSRHQKTLDVSYESYRFNDQISIQLWDTANTDVNPREHDAFNGGTNTHVICVDLTATLDSEYITEKISDLKKRTPEAKFVIIGTKKDAVTDDGPTIQNLESFCGQHNYSYIFTSAKANQGIEATHALIKKAIDNSNCQQTQNITPEIAPEATKAPKTKENALDKLNDQITQYKTRYGDKVSEDFQQALKELVEHLNQKPLKDTHAAQQTIKATSTLLKTLQNANNIYDNDKKTAFQTFLKTCPHTTNQSSLLNKLIKTVAITGICALVGAGLAAGICLSLGLGLGIGVAIASSAAATGLCVGSMTFFRKNPTEKIIEKVASTGLKAYNG